MNKKSLLIGLAVIAVLGGGYLVYRRVRTSSNSAEKNSRRIKIIGRKNVTPSVTEDTGNIESEI